MDWIKKRFESYGGKVAYIEDGSSTSYENLLALIEEASAKLPEGRHVITVDTSSTIAGLAQMIAIAGSENIAFPILATSSETERSRMIEISQCSPLYEQLDASGLILFSSGTTGEPKGMLHDLPALLNRLEQTSPRQDRTLQLLLIDHIGGIDAAMRCLLAGSTLVVPDLLDPETVGAYIEQYQINILPASPTFLNLMLLNNVHEQYNCSSLEIIAYGAEAMPQTLLNRLGQTFPKAKLQQKFGTSETGAIRIQSTAGDQLFFRIKDSDTSWKIIDHELWLKTPSRILGYLNADNNSLETDGWYRTGDLVEAGENNSIRIIGRKTDMINVGGLKVHPSEVEAVLNEIPEIVSCRAFGETDPITGQHVACEIISTSTKDPREWKRTIRTHCRDKLAAWKVPSHITLKGALHINHRLKRAD